MTWVTEGLNRKAESERERIQIQSSTQGLLAEIQKEIEGIFRGTDVRPRFERDGNRLRLIVFLPTEFWFEVNGKSITSSNGQKLALSFPKDKLEIGTKEEPITLPQAVEKMFKPHLFPDEK
jgi:hypothetical protein